MELKYGKRNLDRLIAKYQEDQANKAWLEKSTMACPSCHIHVEKSVGCNHVGTDEMCCGRALMKSAFTTDDMCQVQAALLLPLRREAERGESVRALFDAGAGVLLDAV